MSQHGFSSLDPASRSGGDLSSILRAIQSGHIGEARPSYLVDGMTWLKHRPNDGVAGTVEHYMTYGGADVLMGVTDLDAGAFEASGGGGAGSWEYIEEISLAGAGTGIFDYSSFDGTKYDAYRFEIVSVERGDRAGNSVLKWLDSTNGVNFVSGTNKYYRSYVGGSAAGYIAYGFLGNLGEGPIDGVIELYHVHTALSATVTKYDFYSQDPNAALGSLSLGANRRVAKGVTHTFRLQSDSNFVDGLIRVFGRKMVM